ncbi:hypothetical protein D3C71_2100330 [compost metagenome]
MLASASIVKFGWPISGISSMRPKVRISPVSAISRKLTAVVQWAKRSMPLKRGTGRPDRPPWMRMVPRIR